jgi:hypothetical protein
MVPTGDPLLESGQRKVEGEVNPGQLYEADGRFSLRAPKAGQNMRHLVILRFP